MRYRMAEPIFDDLEPVQPQPEPVIIEVISVSPAVDDDDSDVQWFPHPVGLYMQFFPLFNSRWV